jgi:hypothetical protein
MLILFPPAEAQLMTLESPCAFKVKNLESSVKCKNPISLSVIWYIGMYLDILSWLVLRQSHQDFTSEF